MVSNIPCNVCWDSGGGMSIIRILGTTERVMVWIHRDRGKNFWEGEVAQDKKAMGTSKCLGK